MKKIGITSKHDLHDKDNILEQTIHFFEKQGVTVYIDYRVRDILQANKTLSQFSAQELQHDTKLDFMVTFGGDGTMLRAIQEYLENSNCYFGVNMGHLGFLAEISPKNFEKTGTCLIDDKCSLDSRELLHITVSRNGKNAKEFLALNEVVVTQRTEVTRIVKLKTKVNKRVLTTYNADGLIISTPTGSTAYNLSVGGPILYPTIPAYIVSPINPHSFSQKPIVLPSEKTLSIFAQSSRKPLKLTIDGQMSYNLEENDVIKITKHKKKVHFLRLLEENYFKTIRHKLKWGEGNT